MIIAVDGPAASGKGTIARRLAAHFDLPYLDTGGLYRAVGLAMLRAESDPDDAARAAEVAETLDLGLLDDPALRDAATAEAASRIAVHPPVRAALVDVQRRFAGQAPGAVLDGRDIGTVICPDADHKLFVTADIETRAARRHKELIARGEASIYARVLADLQRRDHRDSSRTTAPTRQADDAVELDTTDLDIEGAVAAALATIAR
ncbi:MAG: (d)CMP kinase [Pseudomonadota bacterium]|nr:(d)CMP kinase [Pseudomonadota bacterium]